MTLRKNIPLWIYCAYNGWGCKYMWVLLNGEALTKIAHNTYVPFSLDTETKQTLKKYLRNKVKK